MFGGGVQLVHLDAEDCSIQLADAIRDAWDQAPHLRSALRASAMEQIVSSDAGMERVMQLVNAASSDVR
jgi:hypothetical protein